MTDLWNFLKGRYISILYLFTCFYVTYSKGTYTIYKSVSFLWEALEMLGKSAWSKRKGLLKDIKEIQNSMK